MLFLLPFLGVAANTVAAALTVGETIGIGCAAFGIGAGIKGAVDYQKAKKLKEEADREYQIMAARLTRRAFRLKKNSSDLAG
jgi:hypothetical protein